MKKSLKITLAVVATAVAIQFIPYGRDHYNPDVISTPKWDSPQTKELFDRACANCHSNRTKWPAYSSVAPVSWLVTHDVSEAREKFNVSMWGVQKRNKGKDAAEEVEEGDMPPVIYTIMHKEARLSKEEKEMLIKGLKKTFSKE